MPEDDDAERWAPIDPLIFEGRRIHAIKEIRTEFGCSLREGYDMLVARYAQLRQDRPEEFEESPETYWEGFQSL